MSQVGDDIWKKTVENIMATYLVQQCWKLTRNFFDDFFQLGDIYQTSDGPKLAGTTFGMSSKNYKLTVFDLTLEHTYYYM